MLRQDRKRKMKKKREKGDEKGRIEKGDGGIKSKVKKGTEELKNDQ